MKHLLAAAVFCAAVGILIEPSAISDAVLKAAADCTEVIIPALFAFTVLSVYMQKSGLYTSVLRPLTFPLSKILCIPEELCGIFVLANIGGYPVGIRLLSELVRSGRLSRRDAGRMLCFCFGSGPSFVIGTAGIRVFGSAATGAVIFAACFFSSLIIALIVCRTGEKIELSGTESHLDISADCFVRSIDSGARVMYTVCVMSVAFAAITALLNISGISGLAEKLLSLISTGKNAGRIFPAFLEITRIREVLPTSGAACLCAGLLSFGGVCVMMQITAISGGNVPIKPLLISRIPAAAMSAVFAVPANWLTSPAAETYSSNVGAAEIYSVNAGLSVCVMIMAGILIYSAEKERSKQKTGH